MRALRSISLLAASALLAAGCGLAADPVVQSEDEVLDALLALTEGAEARATASLQYDTDEVRDVLRDDAAARALLEERLGEGDVDELLAALDDARDQLGDHALLLASGSDGSARVAAEYRGAVWLDLRRGGGSAAGEDGEDRRVDVQARVDWATVSELAEAPDLVSRLGDAVAALDPLLGDLPETANVQAVLVGLLAGDLVALSGDVDEALLQGLAGFGGADIAALEGIDLPPRELLATALAFDGFRREGDATVVEVDLELRAAATLVLDAVAAAPTAGIPAEDLEAARAAVADLPARLEGVAVVRLDGDGRVTQVRADVLDVAVQLASAADPDREEVAVVERVAGQLDDTGLFVTLDVTSMGATSTVLGDPTATATPSEVTAAVSRLLFSGLGAGLDPTALQDLLGDLDKP